MLQFCADKISIWQSPVINRIQTNKQTSQRPWLTGRRGWKLTCSAAFRWQRLLVRGGSESSGTLCYGSSLTAHYCRESDVINTREDLTSPWHTRTHAHTDVCEGANSSTQHLAKVSTLRFQQVVRCHGTSSCTHRLLPWQQLFSKLKKKGAGGWVAQELRTRVWSCVCGRHTHPQTCRNPDRAVMWWDSTRRFANISPRPVISKNVHTPLKKNKKTKTQHVNPESYNYNLTLRRPVINKPWEAEVKHIRRNARTEALPSMDPLLERWKHSSRY